MSWDTACRGIYCTTHRYSTYLCTKVCIDQKGRGRHTNSWTQIGLHYGNNTTCKWCIIAFSISSLLLLSHFSSTSLDHLVNQELITVLFAILYGVTFKSSIDPRFRHILSIRSGVSVIISTKNLPRLFPIQSWRCIGYKRSKKEGSTCSLPAARYHHTTSSLWIQALSLSLSLLFLCIN